MGNDLKQLAAAIVSQGTVDQKAVSALIESLSANELRELLKYLRTAYEKKAVTVTTAMETDTVTRKQFETTFKNTITYQTDPSVGAGVIVKIGDDVYDYTVLNYIENTISQLQEDL
jgi:F0F1-type ATP synthase delta subunit